jgi:hypothetical protein
VLQLLLEMVVGKRGREASSPRMDLLQAQAQLLNREPKARVGSNCERVVGAGVACVIVVAGTTAMSTAGVLMMQRWC